MPGYEFIFIIRKQINFYYDFLLFFFPILFWYKYDYVKCLFVF